MWKKATALLMTMKPHRHIVSLWPLLLAIFITYHSQVTITTVFLLLLSFICFYSGIYQLNEIVDIERDKKDPIRAQRPLVKGIVTVKEVLVCAVLLMTFGIGISLAIKPVIIFCYAALFAINMLYVFVLKKYPYIDLLILATTQVVKFIIGVLITSAVFSLSIYLDTLIVIYLVILAFQIQKQLIRFQFKREAAVKGDTVININALSFLRNIAVILTFIMVSRLTFITAIFFGIYALGLTFFIIITSLQGDNPLFWFLREYDKR